MARNKQLQTKRNRLAAHSRSGSFFTGRRNPETRRISPQFEDHSGYSVLCMLCAKRVDIINFKYLSSLHELTGFGNVKQTDRTWRGSRVTSWQVRDCPPSLLSMNTDPGPEGIPAATIIIFRRCPDGGAPQVLITIRSRTMTFAGGMAVFPGGRVDPADFELAAAHVSSQSVEMDTDEAAHQIAAIRETLEETGLALGLTGDITAESATVARIMLEEKGALAPVLEAFDWSLDLGQITPFARWFPKNENLSRVYDARFYLADLGTGEVDIAVDNSENTRLFWVSAQGALDMAESGEIKLIFPTRRNLERLALFASYKEARAQAEAIPVKMIVPKIDNSSGQPMLTILEDAGYPVTAELLENVARG